MSPLLAVSQLTAQCLFLFGTVVYMIGCVWCWVRIFKHGCGLVIACVLLPPLKLILLFMDWPDRKAFLTALGGAAFALAAMFLVDIPLNASQRFSKRIGIIFDSSPAAARAGTPTPLQVLDQDRQALKNRQILLQQRYRELSTMKATLPAGDQAAIQLFNETAQKYAEELASVRKEEARLKDL